MSKKTIVPSREELQNIYSKEGSTISSLAKLYNTSNPTVRKWLIDYGIERKDHRQASTEANNRNTKYTKPTKEQLIFDYQNLSFNQLCRKHNCNRQKMNSLFEEYLIEKRVHNTIDMPEKTILENLYAVQELSPRQIGKEFGVSNVTVMNWCKKLDIPLRKIKESVKIAIPLIESTKLKRHGYSYFPDDLSYQSSKAEQEIADFLNSYGFDFRKSRNILSGNREIDLFDENKKIAIEYCGCYWHSEIHESKKDSKYHFRKWEECSNQGIQLITLFDVEWLSDKQKIKNFLLSKLGVFDNRIYARKCEIVEDLPCKSFFETNHIQGSPTRIDKSYSLVYDGNIVGAISIGKHHRQNNDELLLNRMAFLSGTQVVGGASKLLSCLKGQGIVTFSDNRWSNGMVYEKAGFSLDKKLSPDYFYYNLKTNEIRSKQSLTKKKMNCPKDKTERDCALELRYVRVWDCGKKRWIMK
jgi:transposase